MLNRILIRIVLPVLLLCLPVLCFGEYKVVVKKNGKILEGKLTAEDDSSVSIVSNGIQLRFKKEDLDLDRMKELNADYHSSEDVRTIVVPNKTGPGVATKQDEKKVDLGELAKQNREAHDDGKSSGTADENETALKNLIADLEEQVKSSGSAVVQQDLNRTKKALSQYKSRSDLSKQDKIFMLEQLIKAIDSNMERKRQAGASDDEIEALKKRLEQKKDELEKAEKMD
jgi:hypothetical protein